MEVFMNVSSEYVLKKVIINASISLSFCLTYIHTFAPAGARAQAREHTSHTVLAYAHEHRQ